jgi:Ca2+-transporting ATPase
MHDGLSEIDARQRLARDGPNELPSSRPRGVLRLLRDVVSEPMFLLLVACGAIYMVLGDSNEALMLLGFVFVVIGITFVQQRRTERSLEALRDLSSPRALVVRDGQARRVAGSPGASWCAATSCCWPKATVFPPTCISSNRRISRSTNPC